MWKLIKAEFSYNKVYFIVFCLAFPVLALFTWADYDGNWDFFYLIFCIIALITSALLLVVVFTGILEKRNRMFALLPLSPGELALSRLLLPLIPAVTIVLFYIIVLPVIYSLLGYYAPPGFVGVLGTGLFGFPLYFIFLDLAVSHKTGSTVKSVVFILTALLLTAAILLGIPYVMIRHEIHFIYLLSGAPYFFLWALLLSYVSVKTFIRRKTYLEK